MEVFKKTGPRKTGRAKVPFDNFDPENYFGDAGLRSAAARGASPVADAQGVKNALRGDFDLGLERRHRTHPGSFPSRPTAVRAILIAVSAPFIPRTAFRLKAYSRKPS